MRDDQTKPFTVWVEPIGGKVQCVSHSRTYMPAERLAVHIKRTFRVLGVEIREGETVLWK